MVPDTSVAGTDIEGLMGGKRPDQQDVDPAEADSTDFNRRREGRSQDERPASKEKRQTEGGMTDDERVDEASEESFPASDPPAQP